MKSSTFEPGFTTQSVQRGLTLISPGKCGSPPIKVTLTELSTSNLRLAFTLN